MRLSRIQRTTLAMDAYKSLVCAAECMVKSLDQQLIHEGLTTGQYRALEALLLHGPMSQAQLCQVIFSVSSSTSLTVSLLQRDGLVTSRADESHGRKTVVAITTAGKKVVGRVMPLQAHLVRALMAALEKREQEVLARLCEKLAGGDEAKLLRELLTTLRGK